MQRPALSLLAVFAAGLATVACTPSQPSASTTSGSAPADPDKGAKDNKTEQDTPGSPPTHDGAPTEGTDPIAVPIADAPTPPTPSVPVEPGVVPVTAVAAVEASVAWREVQTFAEAVDLVPVTRGLLGKSSSGYYAMSEGGVLASAAIEAPGADIMGYWPDNAWFVKVIELKPDKGDRSGEQRREIMLMRLRSERRWVPQEYRFEQRFSDAGQDFRIGNKGGLIVAHDGSFDRVAGGDGEPVGGKCRGSLSDFVETRSGKLYTLCRDEDLYAQIECEDQACVDANAVKLPLGSTWVFTHQVPRQRHSVTLAGHVKIDEVEQPHLLHYETGGWKLESLAAPVTAMWPTKDGGLWILSADQLMHRDPGGVWRKIAVPAGATELSGAVGEDHNEFFLAARVDNTPKLFATPAAAQKPAGADAGEPEPSE